MRDVFELNSPTHTDVLCCAVPGGCASRSPRHTKALSAAPIKQLFLQGGEGGEGGAQRPPAMMMGGLPSESESGVSLVQGCEFFRPALCKYVTFAERMGYQVVALS